MKPTASSKCGGYSMSPDEHLESFRAWFAEEGWTPSPFQEETWAASIAGKSGLVHVPTGSGKTYAAYLGPLARIASEPGPGLRLLYISPLRAMARDIEAALRRPVDELGLDVTIGSRTGDTSSAERRRQKKQMPNVLVTTPESLSLLLSYANAPRIFRDVQTIIVDEWHELMGSKRGTQYELAATRVRKWAPQSSTWALSATIANLEEAAKLAVGATVSKPHLVTASIKRPTAIDVIHPDEIDSFPWYGHMGLNMLEQVLDSLDLDVSTLFFTNTRNQAERWYQAIREARPDWEPRMGLHHGSIDLDQRREIEHGLKSGDITLAVCTSSMDLGVDFAPVERVFQVGSPKGVARIMQRAGRSGHRPGETCRITFVPTHALELFELAALRLAFEKKLIEERRAPHKPLDVLAQHMVTCALGGGFEAESFRDEVRGAGSYEDLTDEEFRWTLALVEHGGDTLAAYPNYRKVEAEDGRFTVVSRRHARMHRSNIGTITSASSIRLKFFNGSSPGHVEESFISRLQPGSRFVFSGRVLEFVKIHDMQAFVKVARAARPDSTPRWMGGHMPLSTQLADSLREVFDQARRGNYEQPEVVAALSIIERQSTISALPAADRLLAETFASRDGYHLFLYPFAGRLVHEGLAALLAYRFGNFERATFSLCVNDYGIEFVCPEPFRYGEALRDPELFSNEHLDEDVLAAINLGELARRQFRKIARVSGLVFDGYPGSRKSLKQLQTSASLLYDVFRKYDPDNLLLAQADREVLEVQFEKERLVDTLERMSQSGIDVVQIDEPTPLAFPLLIDRIRARVSTESLLERIERMKSQWMSAG